MQGKVDWFPMNRGLATEKNISDSDVTETATEDVEAKDTEAA